MALALTREGAVVSVVGFFEPRAVPTTALIIS